MVVFTAEILKYGTKGEKTGWSYVEVPESLARQLKPGNKQSFRVRGKIDHQSYAGLALIPVGEGDFILPINGGMRKSLNKKEGDVLSFQIEEDTDFKIELPEDLAVCLQEDEADLLERFMALSKSHRNYFIQYVSEAKTEATRVKRILMTVEAMVLGLDFGAMIRLGRSRRKGEG